MLIRIVLSAVLGLCLCFNMACAVTDTPQQPAVQYKPGAPVMKYAFVFDGPSDKNDQVLEHFKKTIIKSSAPDYKAEFPKELIFVGNWNADSVKSASNKALSSNAGVVISLGYLSTKYFSELKNKNKFVITIDQYGLRDLGEGFFNPVQQSAKGVIVFKKVVNFKKVAILMNENYYKSRKDWNTLITQKIPGIDFVTVSATNDITQTLGAIPADCDAVALTPLFNLSIAKRQELIKALNSRKLPTYSTLGKEDVELGVLLGSGAYDLDRKVAEASFVNIRGILRGQVQQSENISFFEDEIFYINADTAEEIGYDPHLRILNNAEIITNKAPTVFTLAGVFETINKQNLDIERKRLLVKAARRASTSAMLRYLPTISVNMGYQQYNEDFAESAKLTTPEKTNIFGLGVEQVIFSPALVTNILIKKKMVDFSKAEQFMTEQNVGKEIALLYIEQLILENVIAVQKEYVKESRENLAIARVREKMGFCGPEEALRWASTLSISEQKLLDMTAANKNLKLEIGRLLYLDLKQDFALAELTASDPAFYTSEIRIINYVITPKQLEAFTQMLVDEAFEVAPELEKLRTAMKVKDNEMAMYVQKFVLPDAKISYDYTSLGNRHFTSPMSIPGTPITLPPADPTFGRLGIYAQWKPFEGGTKFAEIARVKAEKEELQKYSDEVKITMEATIRDGINKTLAGYFSIDKNYKAMFASKENYTQVKELYLKGKVPIAQVLDAQETYMNSSLAAANSQYVFFRGLIGVQRGLCAMDWTHAPQRSKDWVQKIKDTLPAGSDFAL